jgi:hypothetical protein
MIGANPDADSRRKQSESTLVDALVPDSSVWTCVTLFLVPKKSGLAALIIGSSSYSTQEGEKEGFQS